MKKRIIAPVVISSILVIFASSAIASGNNDNCAKRNYKALKEELKFSVSDYTGTEDTNPFEDITNDSFADKTSGVNANMEVDSTKSNSSTNSDSNN